jgi:hypothetical protein
MPRRRNFLPSSFSPARRPVVRSRQMARESRRDHTLNHAIARPPQLDPHRRLGQSSAVFSRRPDNRNQGSNQRTTDHHRSKSLVRSFAINYAMHIRPLLSVNAELPYVPDCPMFQTTMLPARLRTAQRSKVSFAISPSNPSRAISSALKSPNSVSKSMSCPRPVHVLSVSSCSRPTGPSPTPRSSSTPTANIGAPMLRSA